ncbi:MAG TPA: hypothetical protein GXX28_00780 [Firmicutes bacterium]|nr:hypothetical protein [Bacillota bacterium]
MRRLWKGVLLGSALSGLAYLILRRRQAGWQKGRLKPQGWGRRTVRSLGRQWRDVQGAWRVGRRVMRRRRFLQGVANLTRRLLP